MTDYPRRHPSGRPVRRSDCRRKPVFNVPDDGPVTPKLRQPRKDLSAIGFHHHFQERMEEGEEE